MELGHKLSGNPYADQRNDGVPTTRSRVTGSDYWPDDSDCSRSMPVVAKTLTEL